MTTSLTATVVGERIRDVERSSTLIFLVCLPTGDVAMPCHHRLLVGISNQATLSRNNEKSSRSSTHISRSLQRDVIWSNFKVSGEKSHEGRAV